MTLKVKTKVDRTLRGGNRRPSQPVSLKDDAVVKPLWSGENRLTDVCRTDSYHWRRTDNNDPFLLDKTRQLSRLRTPLDMHIEMQTPLSQSERRHLSLWKLCNIAVKFVGLETNKSIADYISHFGMNSTNKMEGSMPHCRPSLCSSASLSRREPENMWTKNRTEQCTNSHFSWPEWQRSIRPHLKKREVLSHYFTGPSQEGGGGSKHTRVTDAHAHTEIWQTPSWPVISHISLVCRRGMRALRSFAPSCSTLEA